MNVYGLVQRFKKRVHLFKRTGVTNNADGTITLTHTRYRVKVAWMPISFLRFIFQGSYDANSTAVLVRKKDISNIVLDLNDHIEFNALFYEFQEIFDYDLFYAISCKAMKSKATIGIQVSVSDGLTFIDSSAGAI